MICPKCGNYVSNSEESCPICGTKVRDPLIPKYDEKAMYAAGASCRKVRLWSLITAVVCAGLVEIGIRLPLIYFLMAGGALVLSLYAHKKLRAYLSAGYPMCGPAQAGKVLALISLPISILLVGASLLFLLTAL